MTNYLASAYFAGYFAMALAVLTAGGDVQAATEPLYRGMRAQAMGGAFTAIADDEQAVFYNPAGLAGVKQFSLTLANANVEATNEVINNYATYTSVLSSPTLDSLNTLIGKNLFLRAQATSSVLIPGFQLAAIYDAQASIRLKNHALPTGIMGTQTTYGAQAGFGATFIKFRKKRGEVNFGLAGKVLWRAGKFHRPTLTELLTANYQAITSNISAVGIGFGADLGVQANYHLGKKLTLMAGLAFRDLGTTSFSSGAPPISSNLVLGFGLNYKANDLNLILAYDYEHILDYMDASLKGHLGLEIKFPVISLYAGLNQMSLTYGASIDLWLAKVAYVAYCADQATIANQDCEPRTMISANVKFDL